MGQTLQDVRNTVESEGFDYAFRSYSSFPDVADSLFHDLRKNYVTAANALGEYLNEHTVGECDEDAEEEEPS